ncbi:hypothetical protein B0H12DRAFT_1013214 [Mycena haematopus]|nr:hypothetical protein B0H12DRAFT_1013214 [Mycena haematopus]
MAQCVHSTQAEEYSSLDAMHNTIAQYFGNALGPAPLDSLHPSKILELGPPNGTIYETGIVCRAIQAAMQFPDAQVVAVDQFPMPDRILPANMSFQLADLAQRLEFEDETFDIVHGRLVMTHVVDGPDTLRRVSRLVKPGGLLLIEELDFGSHGESGGPATREIIAKIMAIQSRLGVDVEFGKKVEAIVTSLGEFAGIQVTKVSMPFGTNTSDEALNQLGLGIKKSCLEMFGTFPSRLHDQGLTHEMVREYNEEQERCDNESVMDMYFCWARRSRK